MGDKSEGRVALITGCGKQNGIGAATARRLAANGVIVAVSDVASGGVANDQTLAGAQPAAWQGLDTLTAEIEAAGGQAASFVGDVSDEVDAARLVAQTIERFGRLDILVNNAGAPHGEDRGQIEDIPVDAWQKTMSINALGPIPYDPRRRPSHEGGRLWPYRIAIIRCGALCLAGTWGLFGI